MLLNKAQSEFQRRHADHNQINIVAYLLKARTVEPEIQLLLGNVRMQQ
jgi:hypothetical protein